MVRYMVQKKRETHTDVHTHTHTRSAHVSWQQIKCGRAVIPCGVAEEKKAAESLDSRGKAENKERDGALAQNKRCQKAAASRLVPSDGEKTEI